MITTATGELSDAEADRAGLVPSHAYAVLDIREVHSYRERVHVKKHIHTLRERKKRKTRKKEIETEKSFHRNEGREGLQIIKRTGA